MIEQETQRLKSIWINPGVLDALSVESVLGEDLSKEANLYNLLRRPELVYTDLTKLKMQNGESVLNPPYLDSSLADTLVTRIKYKGYEDRQREEVEKNLQRLETVIPDNFDYDSAKGLSFEVTQKLKKIRPRNLGEALQISGVTPAAISILLVYIKRHNSNGAKNAE